MDNITKMIQKESQNFVGISKYIWSMLGTNLMQYFFRKSNKFFNFKFFIYTYKFITYICFRLDLVSNDTNVMVFSKEVVTSYNHLNLFCRKKLKLSIESSCCNYTTTFDSHNNGKTSAKII